MNILLYLATITIWGSTWLAITFQLGVVAPEVSIFYRFGLASILIFIWCSLRKSRLRYSLKVHGLFFCQGLVLFSLNYLCSYMAGQYISSGFNAIAYSMVLIFNIVSSFIFFQTQITLSIVIGAFFGLSGMITIFWPAIETFDFTNTSLIGIGYSLGAAILASLGNMLSIKNQRNNIPVRENNAYAMGYGALIMLAIICIKQTPLRFDFSQSYIFSLLYLAVFGSVIAFGCFLTLLNRIGAGKASYTQMLIPVIALSISTIYEDLAWSSHMFFGVAIILLGNFIILTPILDQCVTMLKRASYYFSSKRVASA